MEEQEPQPTQDQSAAGLLYHYTDQKGLLGILSSEDRNIWATSIA
jgi:hypothetical protein